MGKFLTLKQRINLERSHKSESLSRYADRIKAVLLLDSNWEVEKIAEALLLDPNTAGGTKNYMNLVELKDYVVIITWVVIRNLQTRKKKYKKELTSLLTDNFQIVSA